MRISLLLVAALLAALAAPAWSATAREFYVRSMAITDAVLGTVVADVYFDDNTPNGEQKGVMGMFYHDSAAAPTPYAMEEVYDYNSAFRFAYCGSDCEANTETKPMPRLYKTTGPGAADSYYTTVLASTIVVKDGSGADVTCSGYQNPSAGANDVSILWVNDAVTPQRVCKAEFGNGASYHLINSLQGTGTAFEALTLPNNNIVGPDASSEIRPLTPTTWPSIGISNADFPKFATWGAGCPTPTCKVQLDLMLVLDESGSISTSNFNLERQFAIDVINSYEIGVSDVLVGCSMFAWTSRLYMPLQDDKQTALNIMSQLTSLGGATCIGCGMQTGLDELLLGGRSNASRVMIVLTDGYNNQSPPCCRLNEVADRCDVFNVEVFGVGVGQFLQSTLEQFVSDPTADHIFLVNDFNGLSTILASLVIATCQQLPGSSCGAGCAGLCVCGNQCLCPSSCDDFNQCTTGTCTPGVNGNGCVTTLINCNPGNDQCLVPACNPVTGCTTAPRVCDDGNPCTQNLCDSASGCSHPPIDCDDGLQCTDDICVSGTCTHPAVPNCAECLTDSDDPGSPEIDCDSAQYNRDSALVSLCVPYNCDPSLQQYDSTGVNGNSSAPGNCVPAPVSCDDGNACSIYTCDTADGLCKYGGSFDCDDGDACTFDTCDPDGVEGAPCNHTAYDPPVDCDDANACTHDTCESSVGCINTPFDIANDCDDGNVCTIDTCDSLIGCVHTAHVCVRDTDDACYTGTCDSSSSASAAADACVYVAIPGTINDCGVCLGSSVSCFIDNLDTGATAAIITGGVLAAIIIAVIVALALGAFGTKKGYDYYQMRKNANLDSGQTSDLYQGMDGAGENPMHS